MQNLKAKERRLCSRRLFPSIYRAAHLTRFRINDYAHPKRFARSLASIIKDDKVSAQVMSGHNERVLIDHLIWVQVVDPETDLEKASTELREILVEGGSILVGYVLQIGSRLQWKRVQISERHMKDAAQSTKNSKQH